jgi:hypothetical protein
MRRAEIDRKFGRMLLIRDIVDFSGVEKFIDMPVKRYSSGMYVRLVFAVTAHLAGAAATAQSPPTVGVGSFSLPLLAFWGVILGVLLIAGVLGVRAVRNRGRRALEGISAVGARR